MLHRINGGSNNLQYYYVHLTLCCAPNVSQGSFSMADKYAAAWKSRQVAFEQFFWDEESGLWSDWDIAKQGRSREFYASSLFPLLWGCGPVNTSRHMLVWQTLQNHGILNCTGVPTSLISNSGQQWDYPNVWAPLVWAPVMAWFNSTDPELSSTAQSIAKSWLTSVYSAWVTYNHTMFEKVSGRTFIFSVLFLLSMCCFSLPLSLSSFSLSTTVAVAQVLVESTWCKLGLVGPTAWPFSL